MRLVDTTTAMQPVLICGHQRSGTTLLASLLDGHRDLAVFPYETWLLQHASAGLLRGVTACEALARVLERCHGFKTEPHFDHDAFLATIDKSLSESGESEITVGSLLELLVVSYAKASGGGAARYWVEKSPMTELRLPVLRREFPGLKAVYMVRDPRDVYLSWKTKREMETAGAQSFTPERVARNWTNSVAAWERFVGTGGSGLLVRYEELVRYPQLTMRRVCDFLEIEFDEGLLRPTQMNAGWHGNSSYARTEAMINGASIGKWHGRLAEGEAARVTAFCGAAMLRLGYSAPRAGTREALAMAMRAPGGARLKFQLLAALWRLYYPYTSSQETESRRSPAWYLLRSKPQDVRQVERRTAPEVTS